MANRESDAWVDVRIVQGLMGGDFKVKIGIWSRV